MNNVKVLIIFILHSIIKTYQQYFISNSINDDNLIIAMYVIMASFIEGRRTECDNISKTSRWGYGSLLMLAI